MRISLKKNWPLSRPASSDYESDIHVLHSEKPPTARCALNTSREILLRCPALMGNRHYLLDNVIPSVKEARSAEAVAVLVATFRSLQNRLATLR